MTGGHRTLPDAGQILVGLAGLVNQLLDVPHVVRHRVGDEGQRGGMPQAGLPADLGADHAGGALQGGGGLRLLLGRAVDRIEDGRLA